MYELNTFRNVYTSKSVGTGPSSYEKKNLPGRGLTRVEKHYTRGLYLIGEIVGFNAHAH